MKSVRCLGSAVAAVTLSCLSTAWANDGRLCNARPIGRACASNRRLRQYALFQARSDHMPATSMKLQVAWTFSTGVLRGHEGAPLVVGNMMYVHTPFPNIVYALDLDKEGMIVWKYEPKQDPNVIPVMCCDTVNRSRLCRRQPHPSSSRHHRRVPRRQDRKVKLVRPSTAIPSGARDQHHHRHAVEGQDHRLGIGGGGNGGPLPPSPPTMAKNRQVVWGAIPPGRQGPARRSGDDTPRSATDRQGFLDQQLGRRPV